MKKNIFVIALGLVMVAILAILFGGAILAGDYMLETEGRQQGAIALAIGFPMAAAFVALVIWLVFKATNRSQKAE